MSDSDSDFGDVDFVSSASVNVRSKWTDSKIQKKDAVEDATLNESVNMTDESFVVSPPKQTVSPAKRMKKSKGKENDEKTQKTDITPPSSPEYSPAVGSGGRGRAVRGANRTKKTQLALQKLERKKTEAPRRGRGRKSKQNNSIVELEDSGSDKEEDSFEIKVKWMTDILRIQVTDTDKMGQVMDRIAEQVKLNSGDVICTLDKGEEGGVEAASIPRDATVANLKLNFLSVLIARTNDSFNPVKEDMIELKVQTKDRRSSVTIEIRRVDEMKVLMEKFCKLKDLELDKIRFYFDGEELDPTETSETLDLDGGECIDVHL